MGVWSWITGVVMVVVGMETQVHAFNFLPVHPPISFSGPPGAQFGFSVALWNDSAGVKRVVIGAPMDNQSSWGNHTFPLGAVHLCQLHLGDPQGDGGGEECIVQPNLLPESGKHMKRYLLENFMYTLSRYGIGVGQTITTKKNKGSPLVVCAPRYPVPYEERIKVDGMCYIVQHPSSTPMKIKPPTGNMATHDSLMGFSAVTTENGFIMGAPNSIFGCGILLSCPSDTTKCTIVQGHREDKKQCSDTLGGWAVQVARYGSSSTQPFIASSSPKELHYMGLISFYPLDGPNPLHTIPGNEIGALFGYALASADLDGDDVKDLLVAAPLARDTTTDKRDVGKVFVYYAPLDKDASSRDPIVLLGNDAWGRFGTSLASLGDADGDGFEDIAVGAPYGGPKQDGVVYIYNGGAGGLRKDRPKVIRPSDFFPGSRGFGFSIDGGLDMDDNSYPDMVIGAMGSDKALLVRASPVIRLHGSVYFDSPNINIKKNLRTLEMPGQRTLRAVSFHLYVNLNYTSIPTFDELKLKYKMELSVDNETTKFGFYHNTGRTSVQNRTIHNDSSRPWGVRVYVQRARSNKNMGISAKVSVNVASYRYRTRELPPVLDEFSNTTFTASSRLVCENATCHTEPDLALYASGNPVILGETPMTMSLNVTLDVRNDPAYGIKVRITFPDHLSYLKVDGNEETPDCRRQVAASVLTCTIGEGDANETINFWLVFRYNIGDLDNLLHGSQFTLRVNNDVNSDTDETNNRVTVVIESKMNATLYPQGFSKNEGAVVMVNQTATEDDLILLQKEGDARTFPVNKLGPRLDHTLSLTNRGPSPVKGVKLKFHVPLYFGTERLTYFMEQPKPSPGVTCTHLEVNPLGLQPPESPVSYGSVINATNSSLVTSFITTSAAEAELQQQRDKREVEDSTSPLTSDSYTDTSTFPSSFQWTTDPAEYFSTTFDPVQSPEDANTLDCKDSLCLVTCTVDLIPARESVNVTFSSYLVTATVNQLGVSKVLVKTWITPEVLQNGSTVINPTVSATTEVFLERQPKRGFSAVPLWILIVSTVAAILLILIIICGLRKAGFFKRDRPPKGFKQESLLEERGEDQNK